MIVIMVVLLDYIPVLVGLGMRQGIWPVQRFDSDVVECWQFRGGSLSASPDSKMSSAMGIDVTRALYASAKREVSPSYETKDNQEVWQALDNPLIWCWPVNSTGAEVPLEPYPLLRSALVPDPQASEYEVHWSNSGTPVAFGVNPNSSIVGFSLYIGSKDPDKIASAVLFPVWIWIAHTGTLPQDYPALLKDLQLREVDGRLGALLRDSGPITIYRQPSQPVVEIRVDLGNHQVGIVRADPEILSTYGFKGSSSRVEGLDPPTSAGWPIWAVVGEGQVGPTVPGAEIAAAKQKDLVDADTSERLIGLMHPLSLHEILFERYVRPYVRRRTNYAVF